MRDHFTLGTTPYDEDCAQVGSENYAQRAREEAKRYIGLLTERHGEPPEGAYYTIKSFPHDFGTYYEACIVFDDEDDEAREYAFKVEGDMPATWSDREAGRPFDLISWGKERGIINDGRSV